MTSGAAFIGSPPDQETFTHLLKRWEWRCVCKKQSLAPPLSVSDLFPQTFPSHGHCLFLTSIFSPWLLINDDIRRFLS